MRQVATGEVGVVRAEARRSAFGAVNRKLRSPVASAERASPSARRLAVLKGAPEYLR